MHHAPGPLVTRLPREPGKRESRYAHLFSGEVITESPPNMGAAMPDTTQDADRIALIEKRLEAMQAEINSLKSRLEE